MIGAFVRPFEVRAQPLAVGRNSSAEPLNTLSDFRFGIATDVVQAIAYGSRQSLTEHAHVHMVFAQEVVNVAHSLELVGR